MFDTQISTILSGKLLQKIVNNQQISMLEYNFLVSALIAQNIPFEVSFSSGTRKNAASLQLTIHINPTVTMVLVVNLEPGASVFTPSP